MVGCMAQVLQPSMRLRSDDPFSLCSPAGAPEVAPTWKGGSHARFCITGRQKAEGACTMSKVTATCTLPPEEAGSGAATTRLPLNAAVRGLPGRRAYRCCRLSTPGVGSFCTSRAGSRAG